LMNVYVRGKAITKGQSYWLCDRDRLSATKIYLFTTKNVNKAAEWGAADRDLFYIDNQ
jgi:hypothetical protein